VWEQPVHLIHISDSHLGPTPEFELHGANPAERTTAIVDRLCQLHVNGVPIDAVIHTGDVTADGDDDQAGDRSLRLAQALFARLPAPLYVINGNHDNREALAKIFAHAQTETLPGASSSLVGCSQLNQIKLFALDARPDPADDPSGFLPHDQLQALDEVLRACRTSSTRCLVYLHYPPLALDCAWMDDEMLISNGYELHRLLRRYRESVSCVLFGHIHQSLQQTVDGILYCAVGASVFPFSAWPGDHKPTIDASSSACFNYVTLAGDAAMIRQLTVHA